MNDTLEAQQAAPTLEQDTIVIDKSETTVIPGRLFNLRRNLSTAAISSVSGSTLYQTVTPNITNALPGRLSGLTVIQNLGEPGSDDASIGIRGIGSYGYGAYGSFKIFVAGGGGGTIEEALPCGADLCGTFHRGVDRQAIVMKRSR